MRQILEFYSDDMQLDVQAGVMKTKLQAWCKERNLFFGVDPGSDATIGGYAATGGHLLCAVHMLVVVRARCMCVGGVQTALWRDSTVCGYAATGGDLLLHVCLGLYHLHCGDSNVHDRYV